VTSASVRRTIEVAVDPHTAFTVFTEHIGDWYLGGRHAWTDPARAVGIRFEPGVGGRWLEVWDPRTGEGYEIGVVRVWEPGSRLVVSYRHPRLPPEPLTEIEVRFQPVHGGTRVTLEHRGWERLPPDAVAAFLTPRAWAALVGWYADHIQRHYSDLR
jgi:Activator of Hsp90 ATPase homolog 1-like protein